jgi:hypothetical protein
VVDGDSRTIRVIGPNRADVLTGDALVWHPADAAEPLTIAVREYFRAALG